MKKITTTRAAATLAILWPGADFIKHFTDVNSTDVDFTDVTVTDVDSTAVISTAVECTSSDWKLFGHKTSLYSSHVLSLDNEGLRRVNYLFLFSFYPWFFSWYIILYALKMAMTVIRSTENLTASIQTESCRIKWSIGKKGILAFFSTSLIKWQSTCNVQRSFMSK